MHNKQKTHSALVKSSCALLLAGAISTDAAAETFFMGRADIGYSAYELEFQRGGSIVGDVGLVTYAVGGTAVFDRTYFDLEYRGTASGDDNDLYPAAPGDTDRNELAFTVGRALDSFSVFGGVKLGTTTFEHDNHSSVTETEFSSTGLYGGIAKVTPIGDNNSLTLSGAVSYLKSTLEDDWIGDQYDVDGDGYGVSLGAKFDFPMGDSAKLYVKADYQIYQYSFDASSNFAASDIDESFLRLSTGISF